MATQSDDARNRARANADKKFQKNQAADQAMNEYEARLASQRSKSAKLRELRMARDAEEAAKAEAAPKPAPKKRTKKVAS